MTIPSGGAVDQIQTSKLSDPAHLDAPLEPAPAPAAPEPADGPSPQPPPAWIAAALIAPVRQAGADGLIYRASSERRADEIGRALRQFAPDVEVLVLPPWDCLPYDRASPSRESMGRRMAVLARLGEPAAGPRVLVASAEAMLQRIPPKAAFAGAFLRLTPGEAVGREALQAYAEAVGYVSDDRVDEPGEIAILGEVADVFPAAADGPVRIAFGEDGGIAEIRRYDPVSQRSEEDIGQVLLGPASELILREGGERTPGQEHRAPEIYGRMETVFSRLPDAQLAEDPRADERACDVLEQIAEAYEARRSLPSAEDAPALPPDALYLSAHELERALAGRKRARLEGAPPEPTPNFALERNPGRAFSDFVAERVAGGRTVVLAGVAHELRALVRAVQRGLDRTPEVVGGWAEALAAAPGSLLALEADLEGGFADGLVLIAAADVLGGRLAARDSSSDGALLSDPDLRVGDVVIHEDHGLGVLRALERVSIADEELDAVRLEYHGGASLLVPVEDFGKLWRYGAEETAVALDRLHTDAWLKRRAELSREIDRTAEELVAQAEARAARKGVTLEPPRAAYARFSARFPYPETPDQAAAIAAVLGDLKSGKVMNRLVCGDVGFGKTEVALRAAAAAALSGRQVAVVAPTTVLARQHYLTFRRRFAGTGAEVAHLSRLVPGAEAERVKAGLKDGSIGVVIGTHALASRDVAFKDLALVVIDEEQRFGAKLKAQLKGMAAEGHVLTMTATPIPRTLQLAMIGVEDVSVIATPPARRRPIRTFLAPFDPATVRTALMREKRRGGQSFVVSPRIEDIPGMKATLKEIAPELSVRIAHGGLKPEEVDEVMVGFADGQGDVLLATNIIESGLDVPRANTMLISRPDRFGLAQLHQLRGRVGRGRAQGVCYLLTDPGEELAEATRARLSTLAALDRLGSGLAISARDLDLRGAGDIVGEEQAGHVKLIGTALYQRLLTRAVRVAKGEIEGPDFTPELNIGASGSIPEAYVPDATIRINLYARLARLADPEEVDAFAEELEDRFGPPPEEAQALVEIARLQAMARAAGVARIDAGPKAVALSFRAGAPRAAPALSPEPELNEGRLVWPKPAADGEDRRPDIRRLLDAVAAGRR